MAKGISLHIGLNNVDPAHYGGWDGALSACEADAKDMVALAKKQGFTGNTMLLSKQATVAAVTQAIQSASKQLVKGDIFFLTYSGHGGQVPDTNHDEDDRMDETWVLFDRQLVDDELYKLYGAFATGVRVVVLSDSCHSGSVTRAVPPWISGEPAGRFMPKPIGKTTYRQNKKVYDAVQEANKGAEQAKLKATVLLISGCQDNQTSLDGTRNGLFTGTMKKVWGNGKFNFGYRRFRDTIASQMPPTQTPNYFVIGAANPAFEAETPFKI